MARHGPINALEFLERMLAISGLLLLALFLTVRIFSAIYSRAEIHRFWKGQEKSFAARVESSKQHVARSPDFRLWSEIRVEAYRASLSRSMPTPLAVLQITSVDLEVPVLEGTDDLTLNRGVGHIEGTALPGEKGNVGIAGHRDGFFRALKDVHPGDFIELVTQKGRERYRVDETLIVLPENVSVLSVRAKPSLTLVTCYPFYFVGSAPQRYIVHAFLADLEDGNQSRQINSEVARRGARID